VLVEQYGVLEDYFVVVVEVCLWCVFVVYFDGFC